MYDHFPTICMKVLIFFSLKPSKNGKCRGILFIVSGEVYLLLVLGQFFFLTFQRLVSSKMSCILKQTCSFQMQVCLSMYHPGFFKKGLSCSWFFGVLFSFRGSFAAKIYLFKVNNRNIRKRCGKCSKLTMRTPEWRHWRCSGVFIVNFGHISHLFLMFLLVTLNN